MAASNYMIRKFHGIDFQQERKTSMINITPLFENAAQLFDNNEEKVIDENSSITILNKKKDLHLYLQSPRTIRLRNEIMLIENLTKKEVYRTSRAKGAVGTFVHPVMFVNAMTYLSVKFEYWANKLVMDHLIEFRNASALSNKAIATAFDLGGLITNPVYQYGTLNRAIGDACRVSFSEFEANRTYEWERATKEQLALRDKIQITITNMIELGMVASFSQGVEIIHKLGK